MDPQLCHSLSALWTFDTRLCVIQQQYSFSCSKSFSVVRVVCSRGSLFELLYTRSISSSHDRGHFLFVTQLTAYFFQSLVFNLTLVFVHAHHTPHFPLSLFFFSWWCGLASVVPPPPSVLQITPQLPLTGFVARVQETSKWLCASSVSPRRKPHTLRCDFENKLLHTKEALSVWQWRYARQSFVHPHHH